MACAPGNTLYVKGSGLAVLAGYNHVVTLANVYYFPVNQK